MNLMSPRALQTDRPTDKVIENFYNNTQKLQLHTNGITDNMNYRVAALINL